MVRIIDWKETPGGKPAFCGYKNPKSSCYTSKKEWIKQEEEKHGLVHKLLYSDEHGAAGGIEYLPGEYAWRPVEVSGYMFITCVYIMKKDYKGSGYGLRLLEACETDAESAGLSGVAAVTRKGSWLAGKELFEKAEYSAADTAPPDYELMVKTFKPAPPPRFKPDRDDPGQVYVNGVHILYSHQCPYLAKSVPEMAEAAQKEFGITPELHVIESPEEARKNPAFYGTFSVIIDGRICEDRPISKSRFLNILKKEL
ncbi:MAG: GNAT family N-acetyltransferase [Spirochaetia bacterium]